MIVIIFKSYISLPSFFYYCKKFICQFVLFLHELLHKTFQVLINADV